MEPRLDRGPDPLGERRRWREFEIARGPLEPMQAAGEPPVRRPDEPDAARPRPPRDGDGRGD